MIGNLLKEAFFVFLGIEFILGVLEYRREKDILEAITKVFQRHYLAVASAAALIYLIVKPLATFLF